MIYKWDAPLTTIVLHHTAVSRLTQPLQFDAVNSYHKQEWSSKSELGHYMGYNFFCEPTGLRTQARKIGEETIAQIGNNCDFPSRCGMVSYCMAGDFRVEKPTTHQIEDFRQFVAEIGAKYPNVVVKQHKDVATGRTCAELSAAEIDSWFTIDDELARSRAQVKQLIQLVTVLLKLVNK